ncbi:MAG: hypothetical protein HY248_04485 [Fimbriimonas ginsengisoli]|uniref:Tetratricopeptide repeat protein n=1 Tax=Fimbriimonas ginsengisoli TaxID=1005039 RepID=A0A931M1G4_FIMGI|nr:hypothetical protein [Fimbriimonas ginsengisoli]MBI3721791.1 hypothetical protein [Fimbriimonas ginsengisoli]
MKRRLFAAGFLLAAAHLASAASPQILLAPIRSAKEPANDVSVALADALAQEMDTDGRVNPVVWSQGDPFFRAAIEDGLLKNPPDWPSSKQADVGRRAMRIDLMVLVIGERDGQGFKASIELYRGGRRLWRDEKNMTVSVAGKLDLDSSIRSLAHTWMLLMADDPLKGMAAKPRHDTPAASPGLAPRMPPAEPPRAAPPVVAPAPSPEPVAAKAAPVAPPAPEALPPAGSAGVAGEAMALVKAGQVAQGIGLLRAAVDEKPQDRSRREALVNLLLSANMPELAADEAHRAAELIPSAANLRLLAAKAWLQAGKPDEAARDLNEALARTEDAQEARELLGQVSLYQLHLSEAITHLDAAIKQRGTPNAHYLRALARQFSGEPEAAALDLTAAGSEDAAQREGRYPFCILVLDKALDTWCEVVRAVFQKVVVNPDDKKAATLATGLSRQAAGAIAALSATPPPLPHQVSHERRGLALKLLAQALSDLGVYLEGHAEESLTDARIGFGEALKQLETARELYRAEQRPKVDNAARTPPRRP